MNLKKGLESTIPRRKVVEVRGNVKSPTNSSSGSSRAVVLGQTPFRRLRIVFLLSTTSGPSWVACPAVPKTGPGLFLRKGGITDLTRCLPRCPQRLPLFTFPVAALLLLLSIHWCLASVSIRASCGVAWVWRATNLLLGAWESLETSNWDSREQVVEFLLQVFSCDFINVQNRVTRA